MRTIYFDPNCGAVERCFVCGTVTDYRFLPLLLMRLARITAPFWERAEKAVVASDYLEPLRRFE